jgi:hypothetical protein
VLANLALEEGDERLPQTLKLNYGFDPIRPRNVMANCLTEFSRVWAYNPTREWSQLGSLREIYLHGNDQLGVTAESTRCASPSASNIVAVIRQVRNFG